MNSKNLVTSLKLSKRLAKLLKEKGMEVETLFSYALWNKKEWKLQYNPNIELPTLPENTIPAFLSVESGELLPAILTKTTLNNYELRTQKLDDNGKWECFYKDWNVPEIGHGHLKGQTFKAKTEAEARGLLYEYLLKNNLIENDK